MKQRIDMAHWKRRELFEFFRQFQEPFYGMTVNMDVTHLCEKSKREGKSLYMEYLHRILRAVNGNESFRLRIEEGMPVLYDTIHVSPSMGKEDGTFAFSFIEFTADYDQFRQTFGAEAERLRHISGMNLTPDAMRQDTIHFSAVPWIRFTSLSHARYMQGEESVPKISTGKIFEESGKRWMPLSVHVHHGLVDGRDVALFLEDLQILFNE